jgi:hypothetical protein
VPPYLACLFIWKSQKLFCLSWPQTMIFWISTVEQLKLQAWTITINPITFL